MLHNERHTVDRRRAQRIVPLLVAMALDNDGAGLRGVLRPVDEALEREHAHGAEVRDRVGTLKMISHGVWMRFKRQRQRFRSNVYFTNFVRPRVPLYQALQSEHAHGTEVLTGGPAR